MAVTQPPPERQPTLDILRGFALLGILMVNFEFFAAPAVTAPEYLARSFPGRIDRVAAWLMQLLFDGKFLLLFSFLFGYGLHIQMTRAAAQNESPLPRYGRRLAGLLIIGLIHATLLFVGDILVTYALMGALLIAFRHASPRTLLASALACWALSIGGHAALGWLALRFPGDEPDVAALLATYRHGAWFEITAQRLRELALLYAITPLLLMPQVLGMFLLGLCAAKTGKLQDLQAEAGLWRRVWAWCLPLGLLGNALYVSLLSRATEGAAALVIGGLAGRAAFTPLGTMTTIAGFALLLRSRKWQRWLSPLAREGRLSLSNYLGESLVCGFLFNAYGFGLYGHVGPASGFVLMLLVFGLQLLVSGWWLRRFSIGPLEWLLRGFVYQTRPPWRLPVARPMQKTDL